MVRLNCPGLWEEEVDEDEIDAEKADVDDVAARSCVSCEVCGEVCLPGRTISRRWRIGQLG